MPAEIRPATERCRMILINAGQLLNANKLKRLDQDHHGKFVIQLGHVHHRRERKGEYAPPMSVRAAW